MTDELKVDNEMVVGVKRVAGSALAEPGEPAKAALNAMWVTIGGVQVPGVVQRTSCINEYGMMKESVDFICSGYRTADAYGPDAPEGFNTKAAQKRD